MQCSGSEMFLLLDPVGLGAGSFLLGLLLEASERLLFPSLLRLRAAACRVSHVGFGGLTEELLRWASAVFGGGGRCQQRRSREMFYL